MPQSKPVPVLVQYLPKPGGEARLQELVERHWRTLQPTGLVTEEPARIWRARGKDGRVSFVELFSWAHEGASDIAHQTPEVMAMWEPMGEVLEDLQIAHLEPLEERG